MSQSENSLPPDSSPTVGEASDVHYTRALHSLQQTIGRLQNCSEDEKTQLQHDLRDLQEMEDKLSHGQLEIVVFGEISTGKSALINAMVGEQVAEVDVQGGWTKEVWRVDWEACAYTVPGLAESRVVMVDTPGLNEVGGNARAVMAHQAATRADVLIFVTDSDLNEIEFDALTQLTSGHKPVIVALNKVDLYSEEQRERLLEVLRERLAELGGEVPLVQTAADPRQVEYVIEGPDGKIRSEWRKPPPQIEQLKACLLDVLDRDGLSLLALNAAMYAADKSDRVANLRIQLRARQANQTIMSYAVFKALAVALNPIAIADIVGGSVVDATMVLTLAHIYGLEMNWIHARRLVKSILGAAGLVMLGEAVVSYSSTFFKAVTGGLGTALTAIPQGAAAGYGSYIVGQAAKYYFEHGASWGPDGPKTVVREILETTDKQSVIQRLRDELKAKLQRNVHADKEKPA